MATVEVLIGDPPCPGCEQIAALAQQMKDEYEDKMDLKIYKGEEAIPKFEEYRISAVPAMVIDEKIRIMGMVPSVETFREMLREAGL